MAAYNSIELFYNVGVTLSGNSQTVLKHNRHDT